MEQERLFEFPQIIDKRGNLSYIEAGKHIPFHIERVYWIYDVPGGQKRGSHAFKTQHEVIIALSGSFDILVDNGKQKRKYTLNRSYKALYIPNMMWRYLDNFSTNAVCLVLSSDKYNEYDYIRNYKDFKKTSTLQKFQKEIHTDIKSNKINKKTFYNTISDCSLIEFPVIRNRAGNITPVHSREDIPFDIERVFYIYDIPSGEKRGMHAHRSCHEVLVATSGSFEVELDDGTNKKTVLLNQPMYGLHIPPGVWATEKDYSSGATCLALTSERYDSEDYINTYSEFKKYRLDAN